MPDGNYMLMENRRIRKCEAFISTYLTEGTHTVELRYQTPGFMVGAGFSLACILIVILIAWIKRHH